LWRKWVPGWGGISAINALYGGSSSPTLPCLPCPCALPLTLAFVIEGWALVIGGISAINALYGGSWVDACSRCPVRYVSRSASLGRPWCPRPTDELSSAVGFVGPRKEVLAWCAWVVIGLLGLSGSLLAHRTGRTFAPSFPIAERRKASRVDPGFLCCVPNETESLLPNTSTFARRPARAVGGTELCWP